MSQPFLHGVETIELIEGTRTVQEVRSAVIGLVGIAPNEYGQNTPKLITNDTLAANYGPSLPGFDIPSALEHIFAQGAGTVIVVNVFDDVTHTTAVVEESHAVSGGKIKLSFTPIGAVTLKKADGTASDYVAGTDYTLDVYGNLKVIPGKIPEATTIKFDYKKLNAAAVTTGHIVGTVDGSGNRTGIKALDNCYVLFGFRPKILITPGRSSTKAIATELEAAAERLKAVPVIDGVYGADVATTIANRGDATKAFGTSNKRMILAFPYLKAYDASKDDGNPETDTNTDYPYSPFLAGAMAARDNQFGYWWSPSNMQLKGVTGVERPISANLSDSNTDTNLLNAAGIVTVFNSFATGFRSWGNRNAAYPTSTAADQFINLLRTFDVVHESLEQSAIQFSDRPGTPALVADIRESGNAFVRRLIGRGALTEGSKVVFDSQDNTVEGMAAGNYVFRIIKMGPTPAERITYKSIIDISLLKSVLK
jgi:phage tail sheath protein FI